MFMLTLGSKTLPFMLGISDAKKVRSRLAKSQVRLEKSVQK